ncbi:STAS domain-containing protein [Streptomyces sp. NPDC048193]|uniref:STAS domain-containing protein n=1 Tax=unclassified Streptomyces TaxID=2593676 RepID=UPI00343491B9
MTEPERLLTVTPHTTQAGPYVLQVTGELDHHSSPILTQAVKEAPFGDAGVIIDLSGLTYCDSTGITVLITAYQRSQATGSPLSLVGVRPDQMRVFQVVGLDQVFTFHATAQEAVSALRR